MASSMGHLDKKVLAASNIILCVSTIGVENLVSVTNATELMAVEKPWVILHYKEEEEFLQSSRIDQHIYFYNIDTDNLYERYSVNSITVTRSLDMSNPIDNFYERRADFQGVDLIVAVQERYPDYYFTGAVQEVKVMPSGDKMYVIQEGEGNGLLEDILVIMKRELNFTIREVDAHLLGDRCCNTKSSTLTYVHISMINQFVHFRRLQRHDKAWGHFDKETKEWSGMIKSLLLNEIDIAWASITIGLERKTVVDFLHPYAKETHCVVSCIESSHKS